MTTKKVSILINAILVLLMLLYAWYNRKNDLGAVYFVLFYLILIGVNFAICVSLTIFKSEEREFHWQLLLALLVIALPLYFMVIKVFY